ncbi:MAG TPA: DNA/RNA helicase domain-containing protein [Chthoniobacterales bacterium]|jgi:DUF2075 family protein
MLITIEEFRQRVARDSTGLISRLQEETGRYGSEEAQAWESSLTQLSRAFQASSFQPLHLFFGSRGNLALEYQMPAASSWADVVLLGRYESAPAAVIIELKDWTTAADRPGKAEGLIDRNGRQELHPSDQVRGYTEYCRRFHSAMEGEATIHGCVLFTHQLYTHAYTSAPNERLTRDYPIFTTAIEDVDKRFPSFFKTRLTQPDEEFARRFATGRYRQQRGFVAQIGAQILDPESTPFELLDNQRRAFALCKAVVDECFLKSAMNEPKKRIVIVKGPPGSGKSAIAARLWASLVTDKRLPEGDVVFTTTSQSQNSNWSAIFDELAEEGGQGLVRKATIFTPLTPPRLGQLRETYGRDFLRDAKQWRANLKILRDLGVSFHDASRDEQNLVTIVDEAHGLINPERTGGVGQFGFVTGLGPQAYHIIRASQLAVFLLDPAQGFRQRENTTIDDITAWSRELGAGEPELISLEGAQFRCAGSAEYVTWLESVLAGNSEGENQVHASAWRNLPAPDAPENVISFPRNPNASLARPAEDAFDYHVKRGPGIWGFDFQVFNTPIKLEAALRARIQEGNSARLLSSYSREWKTREATAPHDLPASMQDFCESYTADDPAQVWSRVWNFVPRGTDYTAFIRAAQGTRMAEDPLCEVGCPYAVRGFDYDYVGVLWLNDLMWRGSRWQVDPGSVYESGIKDLVNRARRERLGFGPARTELLAALVKAYRILLTRPLKGAYLWIPDSETRTFVERSLGDGYTDPLSQSLPAPES